MLNELYTFAEPVQVVPFSSLKWGKFTLLHTMRLHVSSVESARQECVAELFYIITRVASFSCEREEWAGVYDFLVEIGISIPEE